MATNTQVLLTLAVSFVVGILAGYIYGAKTEVKKFYKYPSSHWRVRGK
jgi:hypothetical protein